MLIAHLLATKQEEGEKPVTRARLTESTLRRLFGRQNLTPEFVLEVQEWLFRAGWVLFFAGTTYAVVKVKVLEGWVRISSKLIRNDLRRVRSGEFDFHSLEYLFLGPDFPGEDEE